MVYCEEIIFLNYCKCHIQGVSQEKLNKFITLFTAFIKTWGFPNRPRPTVDKLVFFLVPECILCDLVIYFSIAFLFEIEELDFNFGNKNVPRIQIQRVKWVEDENCFLIYQNCFHRQKVMRIIQFMFLHASGWPFPVDCISILQIPKLHHGLHQQRIFFFVFTLFYKGQ